MTWTIGRLARHAGVGVETVRYYHRRGLVAIPETAEPGARRYGEDDLRRLRFIRVAQGAGFTLAEIGELLALDAEEDRAAARRLAVSRIAAIDAQIIVLQTARDALAALAERCAASASGPCPILEAFEVAARR